MFLKKIHKGIGIRYAIGLLLVLMTFQLCACGKKAEESQEASFYIPAIFRLYRNTSANSFLFEVTDDNLGIEDLTAAGKNHLHYVVIDLCEEELFPGTDKKYQTMVYDVESGNFWLGKDCAHLYSYGKCAIENYRVDTDLLAYVEGKWEVPEYQPFYDYLCSMDWLKTS